MIFRLIRTDFKRITHYGTFLLAAALGLMLVLISLALKADDIIYSADNQEPLDIGIVMSADSQIAKMAYSSIEEMDSYKSSCTFTEISGKDTALAMLENKELFAVIYVPDNIISDIMDGTNTPVEVYYSDMHSINTFVLNDLFRSTSSMLGISQAAIYSVQAIGRELPISDDERDKLSDEINILFLTKVLDRASTFVTTEVNAVRATNTTTFYISAAIILVMMICSSVFIPFVIDVPAGFKTRLKTYHIGPLYRNLSYFISIFMWEYMLYLISYTVLAMISLGTEKIDIHMNVSGILTGVILSCMVSVFILIICLAPAGIHGCTLLLVICTLILAYLSGFFIPETMLPNFAKDMCPLSPLNRFAHVMSQYFTKT